MSQNNLDRFSVPQPVPDAHEACFGTNTEMNGKQLPGIVTEPCLT